MRFVVIKTIEGDLEAINPNLISNIALFNDDRGVHVGFFMAGGYLVRTRFTTVEHAIDYVQRAPSITLEEQ